jgi:hypothetical protein
MLEISCDFEDLLPLLFSHSGIFSGRSGESYRIMGNGESREVERVRLSYDASDTFRRKSNVKFPEPNRNPFALSLLRLWLLARELLTRTVMSSWRERGNWDYFKMKRSRYILDLNWTIDQYNSKSHEKHDQHTETPSNTLNWSVRSALSRWWGTELSMVVRLEVIMALIVDGLEYLHRSSASRKRRRKGNPVPEGTTGTPYPWGYKYGGLAVHVDGVSYESVKYSESWGTWTWVRLLWQD